MRRLDLGLYSHSKVGGAFCLFVCLGGGGEGLEGGGGGGNEVRTHVNSKGKNFLYRNNSIQRRIEPLYQAGQQVQHTTIELFRPPVGSVIGLLRPVLA